MRENRPTLTSQTLDDDQALAQAIEAVLLGDRRYRLATDEILRRQAELRSLCDDPAWTCYLEVEAATNERLALVSDLLVKWAFAGERRSAGQRR